MKFYPTMYKKNVHEVNYNKLKKMGVKCLLFDLDNTLILNKQSKLGEKEQKLISSLKKDFHVIILSNNKSKTRVLNIANSIGIPFFHLSFKPLIRNFKKVANEYNLKPKEICIIGDQLMTDIWGANRFGSLSCLVDPLGSDIEKITGINRFFEGIILKNYEKNNIMKRGSYYE